MAAYGGAPVFPGQNPGAPAWLNAMDQNPYGTYSGPANNKPDASGGFAPENLLGISSYTPETPGGFSPDEDRLRGGRALTGAQGQLGGLSDQYAAIAAGRAPMMSDVAARNAQEQLRASGASQASSGVGARRGLASRDAMNTIAAGQQGLGREHMAARIGERNAAMAGQGQTLSALQGGALQQMQVGAGSQQALLNAQMQAQQQRMQAEDAKAKGIGNLASGFLKGMTGGII